MPKPPVPPIKTALPKIDPYGGADVPTYDVRELGLSPNDEIRFAELAEEAQAYGAAQREAKRGVDRATGAIKAMLAKADPGKCKVVAGAVSMSYYSMERRTLKPELLLENGVSPLTINKCTVVTTSWAIRIGGAEEE